MGKKKKSNFELSASEQMELEKDFEKYFNYNEPVEPVKKQVQTEEVQRVQKSRDIAVEEPKKEMTESEMLCSIMGLRSDNTDGEVSSIFSPDWDKKKKHKATNIDSIIKGKKKRGWKHQLNGILRDREDEHSLPDTIVTTTASSGGPMVIDGNQELPDVCTSGYIAPAEFEDSEDEEEYLVVPRFIFDEESNSLCVFNEYMSNENTKPDVTLCLNHIIPSRANFEELDQILYEDIVRDTVSLVTLLRKPDFVLSYDGMNEFLSHFSYLDYDLVYIYKMSSCMTSDETSDKTAKYLIYLFSPIVENSDSNEIADLFDTISDFDIKLPGFINYLSEYLMNPLVSNINAYNNANNYQLITLGDHDEEEDLKTIIEYFTDPEVDELYADNELWTEESNEEKLSLENFGKCVRMDVQYISYFIGKLRTKVYKFLGVDATITTTHETYIDTETNSDEFEDVDKPNDLIIEKIITGENRRGE